MKRIVISVLVLMILSACAGKTVLSPETQKWLNSYESIVDQYLKEIRRNPQEGPSKEVREKLSRLQKDAVKIKAHLKTREGIPFVREFSRITLKIVRDREMQKIAAKKAKSESK